MCPHLHHGVSRGVLQLHREVRPGAKEAAVSGSEGAGAVAAHSLHVPTEIKIKNGTAVVTNKLVVTYCAGAPCHANTMLQGGEAPRHVRSNTLFNMFKPAAKAASGASRASDSQRIRR